MYASEGSGKAAPCGAELQAGDAQEAARESSTQTAFRIAEKRYQLHREQIFKQRGGRRISKGYVVRQTDFTDVLDPQLGSPLPAGVTCHGVPTGMPPTAAAFTFAAHPGLLLVRGALEPALQRQLIMDAFTRFCEPPNHTNHIRAYPGGLPGIWAAAQQGLRLQLPAAAAAAAALPPSQGEADNKAANAATAEGAGSATAYSPSGDAGSCSARAVGSNGSVSGSAAAAAASQQPLWDLNGSGPSAASLLGKLRWATLGPPYDWAHRLYLRGVPHTPLPHDLRCLAVELASLAAKLAASSGEVATGGSSASCPAPAGQAAAKAATGACSGSAAHPQFSPDAALLNFYNEGDTLNGHIDDAEPSLHQPLVSLSLGCDAIFLMGGHTRDTPPTPLLLHSGDAVVLSGPARRCYHGVPRVLAESAQPLAAGSGSTGSGGACRQEGGCGQRDGCGTGCAGGEVGGAAEDDFAPFARHMQRCRINISIRDTR